MLLTRIVDDYAWQLCEQGYASTVVSCRGHEAAQVGSAVCIEVGQDFTLPYYRDLGVVLTIGMTPYEVFRSHLIIQEYAPYEPAKQQLHWGFHKHNTVTGSAPVATQILHAAGIAFASKLRKAPVITVAYCGDDAVLEPDFLEGIRFAAQHQLPVIFICEQDCTGANTLSCTQRTTLPEGLSHHHIDGSDVVQVYEAMQDAVQRIREGQGPILLEMSVSRSTPAQAFEMIGSDDPLSRCRQVLQEQGAWDETWASQLHKRLLLEVEQAMRNALRDA